MPRMRSGAVMFAPEASARETGHAHLIPQNVRRLSEDEIRRMFPVEYRLLRGLPEEKPSPALERSPRRRALGGIEL